jgi:glycosyltransferase involved in cell wall biosynthesis
MREIGQAPGAAARQRGVADEDRHALLVSDVTMPGGVSTHMALLARGARQHGWRVSALLDEGGGTNSTAAQLIAGEADVYRAPLYHGNHSPESVERTVLKAFVREPPDVVHVHCGSPRSALIARELAIVTSLPLIVTEHFVSPDIVLDPRTLGRLRDVYRHAFAVISVCPENRNLLRDHFRLTTTHHVVIRNATPLPPVAHARTAAGRERPCRVLCVARLTRQKGIDVLIDAVAEIPLQIRRDFRVTIAGSGNAQDEVQAQARRRRIEDQISLIGWSDNVPQLLARHDLFVLPSLAEGQPLALMEALAAGLPSIASAVSGIPELLGNGTYGALVPPGDPRSLADAMTDFWREPTALREKAAAARKHLETLHAPEMMVSQVVQLWDAAAGSYPPE